MIAVKATELPCYCLQITEKVFSPLKSAICLPVVSEQCLLAGNYAANLDQIFDFYVQYDNVKFYRVDDMRLCCLMVCS